MQQRPIDARADAFALGATLWAARRGASPFEGATRDGSLVRVLAHEPPLLTTKEPALARAIALLLEKDPERRPRGFAEALASARERPLEATRSTEARARERPWLELVASDEPFGSILPFVRRKLGLSDAPSFAEALAAIRTLGRPSGDRAAIAAELVAGDRAPSSIRGASPARADPALLKRLRNEALIAILAARAKRGRLVARVARPIDPASAALLDELLKTHGDHVEVIATDADPIDVAPLSSRTEALRAAEQLAAQRPDDLGRAADLFAAAGEPLRAAYYAWRAADRAIEAMEVARAAEKIALAEASLAATLGAARPLLAGLVAVVRARVARWQGDLAGAAKSARLACASLPSGTAAFTDALAELALASGKLGDVGGLVAVARALEDAPEPGAELGWDRASARAATQLFYAGHAAEAKRLVELFLARTRLASGAPDLRRRGLSPAGIVTATLFEGRLDEHLRSLEEAARAFHAIGDLRSESLYRSAAGFALGRLGAYARAERAVDRAITIARELASPSLVALAEHNLAEVVARRGRHDEAIAIASRALEALRRDGEARFLAGTLAYRARAHLDAGDLDAAEHDAREAVDRGRANENLLPLLFGTLALVLIARGQADEAYEAATRANAALARDTPTEAGEGLARLALARSAKLLGRTEEAREVATKARRELELQAARFSPSSFAKSFLERVTEHRELGRLAREGA